jgi:hypothetical protein
MARTRLAGLVGGVVLLSGCTGEVLQRLEMDLHALRERVAAREETRILVSSATAPPQTKTGQLATPTEPHVSVGCPPAQVVRVVERPRRHGGGKAKRGKGRRG